MHKPLYREALSRSWRLVWDHKLVWVYGLFAAFLGQLGILELLVNVGYASTSYALYPSWLSIPKFWRLQDFAPLWRLPPDQFVWALFLFVMLAGLALVMLFVSLISQGALIKSAAQSAKGGGFFPRIGKAWHAGVAHVWRLFFIQVFKKCALLLLTVVVGWATLNAAVEATTSVGDVLVFFGVFLLAILVGLAVSFLAVYAACYVVVEEFPLFQAVAAAWKLFMGHSLVSIEVGLIVLLLNVLVGALAVVGLFVSFLPSIFLWAIAAATLNSALFVTAFGIGAVLFTLCIFFLGAVLTAYTTATWTYLFMKMHKEGIVSRIVHWLR